MMRDRVKPWSMVTGLVVMAAMFAAGCGGGGSSSSSGGGGGSTKTDTVHVGVVLPLTGALAASGENSREGIELATQMINSAGGIKSMGGAKIKLDIRDATSDPTQAAAAMTQLVSGANPPIAVIGAYASALTLTASQVAERKHIPMLTTSFADDLSSRGYHYTFQVAPQSSAVGVAQMQYALDAAKSVGYPVHKVAITYGDTAAWQAQAPALRDQAKKAGLDVAVYESYPADITDANPIARKLINAKPDLIFPFSYVPDGVLLVRALHANGNTAPLIGSVGGFVTPEMKKALGPLIEGAYSIDSSSPDAYGEIAKLYESKHHTIMPQEAHDNGAALYVLADALEQKPSTDPVKVADALHAGTFKAGAAGEMPGGAVKFDEQGKDVLIKPVIVQWQGGRLVTVWPESEAHAKPEFHAGT